MELLNGKLSLVFVLLLIACSAMATDHSEAHEDCGCDTPPSAPSHKKHPSPSHNKHPSPGSGSPSGHKHPSPSPSPPVVIPPSPKQPSPSPSPKQPSPSPSPPGSTPGIPSSPPHLPPGGTFPPPSPPGGGTSPPFHPPITLPPPSPPVGGAPYPPHGPYIPPTTPPIPPSPVIVPSPPPSSSGTCPVGIVKLNACVPLLGLDIHIGINPITPAQKEPCCALLGLLGLDAEVCLCLVIDLDLLHLIGVHAKIDAVINVFTTCNIPPPVGLKACP